jgi:pimeloyl-ACP methyl ester carboxylesterase
MLTSLKPHQTGTALANGMKLYYETFGDRNNPAVLLIMGLSCQCLQWFPYFIEPIVRQGYYVIRFDNRDVGLSTWIDPDDWQKNPYSLEDLAQDTVELLQALGIDKAHIIGASMGGAIAQQIAISYPTRVLSLTSIVSFADASALGMGGISLNFPSGVPSLAEYLGFWSMLAGTTFPLDVPLYTELYQESVVVRQGYNPNCMVHQLAAIGRSSSRMAELGKIGVPTLVLYGTADPLIQEAHAIDYASLIPGSKLIKMDGVGHDIPQGICDEIHPAIFNLLSKEQNIMSELKAVQERFIEYSKTFEQLDPTLIPPFLYLPSMLMTPEIIAPPMTSKALVEAVFQEVMKGLKEKGYSSSKLDRLSARMLSENTAIVSGSATRYKKEEEVETELEKIGFTYTLRKDKDNLWKIIVGVIHDPESAIAL